MTIPLVLISGLLSNQRLWYHQVNQLEKQVPIHIFSPCQNTPEKMVQAILDAAPPRFALAGHSMGGWLCLEIMRSAPSRVAKLCLLNTTARDDTKEKRDRRLAMIKRVAEGDFKQVVEEILPSFIHNLLAKSEVQQMFLEVGSQTFLNQEMAMIKRKPCKPILPTITCPTLVIHAAEDKNFTLQEHQELAENIPNAKLAIVDNSGHMSPLEAPQAITALLEDFLPEKPCKKWPRG